MACAATSLARTPIAAAPLVVRLVFIRDTVNLPSVIPLSQASRLCWVQSSRATGTVMTGGNLPRRNVRPFAGWTRSQPHDRHADRDAAHESGAGCHPPFP